MDKNPSVSNRTAILLVAGLLGLGFIILFVLLWLVFRQTTAPSPVADAATLTPTISAPALYVPPAPDCGAPTLAIGATILQIETISLAPDGSVSVPEGVNGVAYWVDGTDAILMFLLSPTPENLALAATLTDGSVAKLTWSNCNSMSYTLSAPQPGIFGLTYYSDQSTGGISIFFRSDSAGNGFVVGGGLTEEEIVSLDAPENVEVQAEISLLEIVTSPDGATIQVEISIFNYGGSPFSLSANDISLTAQDGTPLNLILSDPALPREVLPGATEAVHLTFPRPGSPTATLRIFTAEYEIEGY